MSFAVAHLEEAKRIIDGLDAGVIDRMAELLAEVRSRDGRLFFLGVGGSAGNCSHAVNDFRKIAGIEAYAPTDNVSELTARTNDEGWETVFVEWLKVSRLKREDAIFVFSVGGGSLEKNVSPNLVRALQYAKEVGATIIGVVGRDGGFTAKVATPSVSFLQSIRKRSRLTLRPFRPWYGIFWLPIRRSRRDRRSGKGFVELGYDGEGGIPRSRRRP